MNNEINIGNIGKLIITENLQKIIDYLHISVGSTEWSGVLFYKLTKGNVHKLKDLEFKADFLYPMDIGNSTYTEIEFNGEIMNAYDIYANGIESSTGLTHSHHGMKAFFSGTDQKELVDNAKLYNYYISLIVSFDGNYCAKIAFPSKTENLRKSFIKDSNGKLFTIQTKIEETVIYIGDLEIVKESKDSTPEWLVKRKQELDNKKQQKVVVSNTMSWQNQQRSFDFDFSDNFPNQNYYRNGQSLGSTNHNISKDSISGYRDFPKSKITGEQFLSALLNLDSSKLNEDLDKCLENLSKLNPNELDEYEVVLDSNYEIIHEQLYNCPVSRKNSLAAFTALAEFEHLYGGQEFFETLTLTLTTYAY